MLIEAIFQKILHNSPGTILIFFLILCALVGFISSLLPALFFQLLESTPKAKARKRREINAELQRKYEGVCAELVETRRELDRSIKESMRLVGLLREEHSHNRDWDIRTRRELDTITERRA
jgi:sensor histidine kinase regulating citrate/malate metabolism